MFGAGIRSSVPVWYTLILAENAQTIRITLYSSILTGVTSKNTGILLERPTFTQRPSYMKQQGDKLLRSVISMTIGREMNA